MAETTFLEALDKLFDFRDSQEKLECGVHRVSSGVLGRS